MGTQKKNLVRINSVSLNEFLGVRDPTIAREIQSIISCSLKWVKPLNKEHVPFFYLHIPPTVLLMMMTPELRNVPAHRQQD